MSWLTFENGKDAIEASEVAVAVTTGEAATDAEAIGLLRTATEASGADEIDPFRHLAGVEVPTVATVIDTSRKTDVAVVAAARRPGRCLPTPEAQRRGLDRGLASSLGVGVVADGRALDQSLHHDEASNLVDHRLVAMVRASGPDLEAEMTRLREAVAGGIRHHLIALPSPAAADIRQRPNDADTPAREADRDLPLGAVGDDRADLCLRHTRVHAVEVLDAASPSENSLAAVALLAG